MWKLFLKGFGIGAASIVPGLSGGTIALIMGIYARLIGIAGNIDHRTLAGFVRLAGRGHFGRAFEYAVQTWQLHFLIPIGAGALVAIFSTASLINFAISNYRGFVYSFFFGLVLVSIYYPLKRAGNIRFKEVLVFCLACALILLAQLSPLWSDLQGFSNIGALRFFLGGAVAMATMLLPGFSGSFMLVVMGVYFEILTAVASMDLKVISLVALGCVFGLISLAKVIRFLLTNFYSTTMCFLAGLMFGSLSALWPFQKEVQINEDKLITAGYILPESLAQGWPYFLCFVTGAGLVFLFILMDIKTGRHKKDVT
ncbi:DUF368 domain-containing protein [Desulfonatronovibrio magnus]|uniref:DUF368 domain-containing protein n=1 Tax=Desulfonatronovibrio magnus TaxID=698827 RepID=UPI0005EBBEAA|nr:DUF368 domain-containing protein [Desulfonatronovibrio magnus]